MTRRGVLGLLGGTAAGMVLDPERLLWVPGRKLISIPAVHDPRWAIYDRRRRWVIKAQYALFPPSGFDSFALKSEDIRITFETNSDRTLLTVTEYHFT